MEIGPSRFWVQGNHVPKYNTETEALLPYYRYLPHRFDHPRNWSAQASAELREHVLLVLKVQVP